MKTQIRREAIENRDLLSLEQRHQKSTDITSHVLQLEAFKQATTILLYMSFRSEVETKDLIAKCLSMGKIVALPLVNDKKTDLILVKVLSLTEDLSLSSYGILEPINRSDRVIDISAIDLVLAPGVAFDLQGNRMGYGAGYYDRLLSSKPPHLKVWALAFDVQIVPSIPHDDHDQPMDGIITESGLTLCRR